MRKIFGLPLVMAFVVAISFAATMTSVPMVSSSVSSVKWKEKDIKNLTTLNFTSSFIVTGTTNDITITINNKGPAAITVTRVKVHKVTPVKKGYSATPLDEPLSVPISAGETKSLDTITYTSQTGANVHLWVYFTISGQEYHIGVNLHFR